MTIQSVDPHSRDRDQWPKFRTESAAALMKNIDCMLAMYRQKNIQPVLCFYFHPWEFYEMPQGLIHFGEGAVLPDPFIVKNCGKYALEQLDLLIRQLKDRGAVFKCAKDIV